MSAARVTLGSTLLRQRLRNTRLIGAPFRSPTDALAWLGAVQAQDYAGAKWALGQRLRPGPEANVEAALEAGKILRTHVLRPTWHFVLPADIRWMLALTAPRIRTVMAYYERALELNEATYRRSNGALAKALQGGKHLTRNELARALEAARIRASGPRLAHLVMRAELDAILCSGPRRGKQFTYALLDEHAPATRAFGREEALAELTRRYVKSHGPCLPQDFAWWSGLSVAEAKRGLSSIASELRHVLVDGKTYWSSASEAPARASERALHLLPNYDEYLIAYKDHGPVLDGTPARELGASDNVLSRHILVLNGQVAGGWRSTLTKGAVTVEVTPLAELRASDQQALVTAAERYAGFWGSSLTLKTSPKRRKAAR